MGFLLEEITRLEWVRNLVEFWKAMSIFNIFLEKNCEKKNPNRITQKHLVGRNI